MCQKDTITNLISQSKVLIIKVRKGKAEGKKGMKRERGERKEGKKGRMDGRE